MSHVTHGLSFSSIMPRKPKLKCPVCHGRCAMPPNPEHRLPTLKACAAPPEPGASADARGGLAHCHHQACEFCLVNHVYACLRQGVPVSCPHSGCRAVLVTSDIERIGGSRMVAMVDQYRVCDICMEIRPTERVTMPHAHFDHYNVRGGRPYCAHMACEECLASFIKETISVSSVVRCPFPDCDGELVATDIQRIGGVALLAQYQAALAARADPSRDLHACGPDVFLCQTCHVPIFKDGGCPLVRCICGTLNAVDAAVPSRRNVLFRAANVFQRMLPRDAQDDRQPYQGWQPWPQGGLPAFRLFPFDAEPTPAGHGLVHPPDHGLVHPLDHGLVHQDPTPEDDAGLDEDQRSRPILSGDFIVSLFLIGFVLWVMYRD